MESSARSNDGGKVREVEIVEKAEQQGESSSSRDDVAETSAAAAVAAVDMETIVRKKIVECGLGDMKIPNEMRMSGCSECEDSNESDDDDDLCSTSSDDSEDSYNPFASGVLPPVLPDIQLRVPMENEDDVRKVKDALLIKGVLDVVCDEARQIVTVTGIVPPSRLLKKARKVKRQARILSTVSPFAVFINPHFGHSAFTFHEEEDDDESSHSSSTSSSSHAIDIPSASPVLIPMQSQRPRPTFQRYNFRNDPHSPYLRTFSLSDLSSPSSCSPSCTSSTYVTGDAFDHHRRFDSSFFHDDLIL